MATELDRSIERFLRNAVRERSTEDRILRQALRDLRLSLESVRRFLDGADLLTPSPGREQAIRTAVQAIAASMARQWGQPTLQGFQEAMVPWFEQQLELARDLARIAGDSLPQAGAVTAANAGLPRIVNNAVVGGKTLAQSLQTTVPALVADRVERLIRLGLSDVAGETFATYKDAVVRTTENTVEAIIRTGVHEVGSAAQQLIYEVETSPDFKTAKALVWTAVLDGRTCPICIGLDGKRFPADYRKVSPHFNCILADTLIDAGSIIAGMRSSYSGDIVTIHTVGGRILRMTENHPVLTSNGWKPAKLVKESDQLVSRRPESNSAVNENFNQCPPTAEQLFTLLSHESEVVRRLVPPSPVDFHGDGIRLNGNVEIAPINWQLLLNAEAVCLEHGRNHMLVFANSGLVPINGLSSLDALLLAVHSTASGIMSGSNLPAALLNGHLSPLDGLGLALSARRDPGFDEPFADRQSGNAKMIGDLVFAHSRLIEFDDVINVKINAEHDVPVYDFTTVSGTYLANGIVTHNCRCYLVPTEWRGEPGASRPSGEGLQGPEVSFSVAARDWVKGNREAARDIFGKRLGDRLADGELDFNQALKQWRQPRSKGG